jgi:hypothetical protein
LGSQYFYVYPRSMNDERFICIFSHIEKCFPYQIYFPQPVTKIFIIAELAAGIQPYRCPVG